MKSVPSWVSYSVYRVLLFAAPLAILLILGIKEWIAAVVAAIVGMSLSFIFLRKPRENVARDLYAARHRDQPLVHEDAEREDAALDRLEAGRAEEHADADAGAASTPRDTAQ
ncbi:DUF4229 domain-containing protein [Cryobacterium psychrophilum]|uniref:DUF4229 domain-containing protein n=1 Tax=Cryobacterium psychrophilum TaxID=41988 RepID=A0A4Y8KNV1_9MICO|nr:DUF4229 domain-containing protein [Cryobacterium psychrophilum]TDW30399.1 uncharacterized protein DUF4229 [Cryobacterium psychrophilum]TFD79085.1 DUF4229 domain-containing protein [Cryobacterium psychrophilum]